MQPNAMKQFGPSPRSHPKLSHSLSVVFSTSSSSLVSLFITLSTAILLIFCCQQAPTSSHNNGPFVACQSVLSAQDKAAPDLEARQHSNSVPSPLQSASYISLDGLTLVIAFSKPVNLSSSIESVEQRLAAAAAAAADYDQDSAPFSSSPAAAPSELSSQLSSFYTNNTSSRLPPRGTQQQTTSSGGGGNNNKLIPVASANAQVIEKKNKKKKKAKHDGRVSVKFSRGDDATTRALSHQFTSANLYSAASTTSIELAGASSRQSSVCRIGDTGSGTGSESDTGPGQETPHVIGGVQLCAQLLTRKTLKLLHKYRLYNCLWTSQVQFIIQLGKPVKSTTSAAAAAAAAAGLNQGTSSNGAGAAPAIKIAFRRGTLSGQGQMGLRWNEQDVAVELNRLPLEGLGVPLAPRLALTGPNQVPACGQFSLSAHLSSPYGTQPDEAVKLQWTVERVGLIAAGANTNTSANNSTGANQLQQQQQSIEALDLQWRSLQQLVALQRSNNLVLDAQLLQYVPQLYEFRLAVTFTTSLTSFTLNATHQVGRLDFDAPIGTIYGSHLLGPEQQVNTNGELALLADIQVPECAQNIKQVGLYWQVSDPRVRFEQTYAPFYVAKSNTLPEQALIEFRLNLFYGIRVKKFASAGTLVPTGDSVLDAQISDGLLMASVGQPQEGNSYGSNSNNNHLIRSSGTSDNIDQSGGAPAAGARQQQQAQFASEHQNQLELFAISGQQSSTGGNRREQEQDKYTYQWSCFDGKTAQPCYKSLKVQASSGGTQYDIGSPKNGRQSILARPQLQLQQQPGNGLGATAGFGSPSATATANLLLVDKARQRQPILRLPLSWFESDAQLWFGLQRFDRHNPSQHSKTEYALINVYPIEQHSLAPIGGDSGSAGSSGATIPAPPSVVSIGPVLIGRSRQRATLRNPLTGAIVLLANTPAIIVGRLSPGQLFGANSFAWRIPNYAHPLHWTSKNVTNAISGQEELVTELHLQADMLLAHAHYQVQLDVCSGRTGARSLASISVDIVQGISQCRVEMMPRPELSSLPPATLDGSAGSNPVPSSPLPPPPPQQQQMASGGASANVPLVITVNYCNIPLGLSPVTYQLYIVDTSASDAFIESTRPASSASSSVRQQHQVPEDDYTNEADELYYEGQAQPLTVPQLSPVFTLNGLNGFALMALMQQQRSLATSPVRIRFAARVCNRLQSCRMFYSNSLDPIGLLASSELQPPLTTTTGSKLTALGSGTQSQAQALELSKQAGGGEQQRLRQNTDHAIEALRAMLSAAKRANVAGNSIAAISILNALLTLAQRLVQQAAPTVVGSRNAREQSKKYPLGGNAGGEREPSDGDQSDSSSSSSTREAINNELSADVDLLVQQQVVNEHQLGQLRDVMQVAMRDCLHYGAQSLQRQFHYTESGQTNLVLLAMSKILALQHDNLDYKYRAMRLIGLLVRKSIEQGLQSAQIPNSLPDFKTIQAAYESLFGTFGQHSIEPTIALSPPSTSPLTSSSSSLSSSYQYAASLPSLESLTPSDSNVRRCRSVERQNNSIARQGEAVIVGPVRVGGKVEGANEQNNNNNNKSNDNTSKQINLAPLSEAVIYDNNSSNNNNNQSIQQQRRQQESVSGVKSNSSTPSSGPLSWPNSDLLQRDLGGSAAALVEVGATAEATAPDTITAGAEATVTKASATISNSVPLGEAATTTLEAATTSSTTRKTRTVTTTTTSVIKANKRNKEEAVLAHLRLVRLAHRSLLQAAAVQLPLGAVQQFEYQSAGAPLAQLSSSSLSHSSSSSSSSSPSSSSSSLPLNDPSNNNNNNINYVDKSKQQTGPTSAKFVWAQQPMANIVSSLTHQTDLLSDTIDVDLHEFGSVSVKFRPNVLRRLSQQLSSQVRCRNDTQIKCSSFVLALTSFAGKAPFRSLDSAVDTSQLPLLKRQTTTGHNQRNKTAPAGQQQQLLQPTLVLRVPVIQLDWLSPIDGSSLIDLLRQSHRESNHHATDAVPSLADFKATVTFRVPRALPVSGTSGDGGSSNSDADDQLQAGASTSSPTTNSSGDKYKCYKFVEGANEWIEADQLAADSEGGPTLADDDSEMRIRCSFDGFGVLGAFQGKPPPVETSTELSIALGLALILIIVTIFSLLGCIASNSKAKQRRQQELREQKLRSELDSSSGGSNSRGSTSYDESDDYYAGKRQSR